MKVLLISAANICKQSRKLLYKSRKENKQATKDHVVSLLDMKILFHILTYYCYITVRSLFQLVDDPMRIIATVVEEEHRDFEAY